MRETLEKLIADFINKRFEGQPSSLPKLLSVDEVDEILDLIYDKCVVIPRGSNPVPNADFIHAEAEGHQVVTMDAGHEYPVTFLKDKMQGHFRIKPDESDMEYLVSINYLDGEVQYTNRYFTKKEFDEFGFGPNCSLVEHTGKKRID